VENNTGSSELKLELNEDKGIGDSGQTQLRNDEIARLQSLTYESEEESLCIPMPRDHVLFSRNSCQLSIRFGKFRGEKDIEEAICNVSHTRVLGTYSPDRSIYPHIIQKPLHAALGPLFFPPSSLFPIPRLLLAPEPNF